MQGMIHPKPPDPFWRDSGVEETPCHLVHRGGLADSAGTQDKLETSWRRSIGDALRETAGDRAFPGPGEHIRHHAGPMPRVLLGENPPQILRARPPGRHVTALQGDLLGR